MRLMTIACLILANGFRRRKASLPVCSSHVDPLQNPVLRSFTLIRLGCCPVKDRTMNRRWIVSLLILWSLLASPTWLIERAEAAESAAPTTTAPQKAQDLLAQLQARHGDPLPGYIGGREFHNREHRLPPGHYHEYDVNPKIRGRSRDAERIVVEQDTGRAYYSGDHYRTFTPLDTTP